MHIYNDEYSSIKNDLVKKTEECEIAAKLGKLLGVWALDVAL